MANTNLMVDNPPADNLEEAVIFSLRRSLRGDHICSVGTLRLSAIHNLLKCINCGNMAHRWGRWRVCRRMDLRDSNDASTI
jgi:hypothetical protein